MKRAVAWFAPIALAYLGFDIVMDAGKLGARELLAAVLRAALWFLPLPLVLAALERLTARIRVEVIDAAAMVVLAALSALSSDVLFILVISCIGPPQYMWIPRSASAIEAIRLALRFVEPPLLVVLATLFTARWTAARAAERDEAARAARLEARLHEARLQLLRSQLHPHFLFNSLNSVAALIRSDRAEAARMLEHLRRFYSAAAGVREVVPLAEELSLAGEYLGIEQIRFASRLHVVIDAGDDVRAAAVPALLLQPLAENAVRHGVSRLPGPGFVRIEARRAGNRLRLTIENRAESGGPAGTGIGLANTRARLEQMYGGAAALETSSENQRFRVTIALPLREVA